MVTVNITVTDEAVQPEIYLGRQGEKQAREIVFDLSALTAKYGAGTATLCHQRSRDTAPYVVGESTGDTLAWVISDTDTAFPGIGFCEFRYTFGSDSLSKSTMFATNVKESLSDDIVVPEPLQSYFDKMMDYIKSRGNAGAGMTSDVISALLDCFAHVAWIDEDGQDYYDALEDALHDIYWNVSNILTHCASSNPATSITKGTQYLATITPSTGYTLDGAAVSVEMGGIDITSDVYSNGVIDIPAVTGNLAISVSAELIPVTVESIAAVYTQSGTVYSDATLDSLKSGLVVTATYSDASTAVVPYADYVLSGALVVGTSTITVTYGGKTDTFAVAVTKAKELVSISAAYTQTGAVYTTDTLDSLKDDLVITATYDDSSTAVVSSTDYTLSGTLAAGTSIITVTYGEKTCTFTVTVSVTPLYNWDFTSSLVDSVSSVTATLSGATRSSDGVSFTAIQQTVALPGVYARNRTYEIDVASASKEANVYGRLWGVKADPNVGNGGTCYVLTGTRKGGDLFYYNGAGWDGTVIVPQSTDPDGSYYANSTVGIYVDADGYPSVYKNGILLGTGSNAVPSAHDGQNVYIGASNADTLYPFVFTGYRIYEGLIYS